MSSFRKFAVASILVAMGCGGATVDSSSATDSGVGGPDTSMSTTGTDASVGMPPLGITCGSTSCDPATQFCCASGGGRDGGAGETCVSAGGTCQGAALHCSGPATCAGQICCEEVTRTDGGGGPGGGQLTATCTATCTRGITLCDVDTDCTMGDTCQPGAGGLKSCRRARRDGGGGGPFDASLD